MRGPADIRRHPDGAIDCKVYADAAAAERAAVMRAAFRRLAASFSHLRRRALRAVRA